MGSAPERAEVEEVAAPLHHRCNPGAESPRNAHVDEAAEAVVGLLRHEGDVRVARHLAVDGKELAEGVVIAQAHTRGGPPTAPADTDHRQQRPAGLEAQLDALPVAPGNGALGDAVED